MKNSILLLFTACSLIFTSCAKQEGCTDSAASNYSSDADTDDGSCTYKASLVFWWDQTLSEDADLIGATAVNVTVDGVFQGSIALSSFYFTSIPTCGASSTITASINLGKSKSKTVLVKYELMDGSSVIETITETISVSSGCNVYQL